MRHVQLELRHAGVGEDVERWDDGDALNERDQPTRAWATLYARLRVFGHEVGPTLHIRVPEYVARALPWNLTAALVRMNEVRRGERPGQLDG